MNSDDKSKICNDNVDKFIKDCFKKKDNISDKNIPKKINNIGLEIFRVCCVVFLAVFSFSIAAFSYIGSSLQLFEMTLPLKVFIGFSITIGVFIALIAITLFLRYILKVSKDRKENIHNYKEIKKTKKIIKEKKSVFKEEKKGDNKKDVEKDTKTYISKLKKPKSCNDLKNLPLLKLKNKLSFKENEFQKYEKKLFREIEASIEKWGYLFKDLDEKSFDLFDGYNVYKEKLGELKISIKKEKLNIKNIIKSPKDQDLLLKKIVNRQKNFSIQIESLAELIEEENLNEKQFFFLFFLKVFDKLVKNSSYYFMDILVFSARVLKNKIAKIDYKGKTFLIENLYSKFMEKLNNKEPYRLYFFYIREILLRQKLKDKFNSCYSYLVEKLSYHAIDSAMQEITSQIFKIHTKKLEKNIPLKRSKSF